MNDLLPVCAWCKKARDGQGNWKRVETAPGRGANAGITHSICPDCERNVTQEEGIGA